MSDCMSDDVYLAQAAMEAALELEKEKKKEETHIHLKEYDKPTYDELVDALELMANQYLQYKGELNARYMTAGERCLSHLERLGLVEKQKKSKTYLFTEKSRNNTAPWE